MSMISESERLTPFAEDFNYQADPPKDRKNKNRDESTTVLTQKPLHKTQSEQR